MSEKFPSVSHEVESPQDKKGRLKKLGHKAVSRLVKLRENRKLNKEIRKLDAKYAAEGKAIAPGTELYGKHIERAERQGSSFAPELVAQHEAAVAQNAKDAEYNLAWDQAHATKELQDQSKQYRDMADHAEAVRDAVWNGSDNELVARDAANLLDNEKGDRGRAASYARSWDMDMQFKSDDNKPKIRDIEEAVAKRHAENSESELK